MEKGEKDTFTCQNPTCGKSFTSPLKTLNLRKMPSEPYFACPYCLTKIVEDLPEADEKPQEIELGKAQPKTNREVIENPKTSDKQAACNFHPGYLSERSSKEQIPDECLVCKDIVDCMLKKMRD